MRYLGPFVYRLGRHPFTVQRGVRFPYGLPVKGITTQMVDASSCSVASATRDRRPVVRGRSSAWLEHSTVTREVAGSNPVAPVLDSLRLSQVMSSGIQEF